MKLVTLPHMQGSSIVLNSEAIVAIVPIEGGVEVLMTSGDKFSIGLMLEELIPKMSLRGWRK